MNKLLPVEIDTYSRVYARVPTSNYPILIHLVDLHPGRLNRELWELLNQHLELDFKSICSYQPTDNQESEFQNPDNPYEIIKASITNLYSQIDLNYQNNLSPSEALVESKIILPSGNYLSYMNNSKELALVSGNSDAIFPHSIPPEIDIKNDSIIKSEAKIKQTIQFLIPYKQFFIAGLDRTSFSILTPIDFNSNLSIPLEAYLTTLYCLLDKLNHYLHNNVSNNIKNERKTFSYALSLLEDYMPEEPHEIASTSKPFSNQFPNVYFTSGLVIRKESKKSKLYPSVSFSDCDTEFDAIIKLLNTSSIPYRVSDPPKLIQDSRTYLFVSEDEKLFACLRHKYGYIFINNEKELKFMDGDPFPLGQLITIYPTSPEDNDPIEFLKVGMTDAWLPLAMIFITWLLLSASTLLPAYVIS